jgi:hypothetical protein
VRPALWNCVQGIAPLLQHLLQHGEHLGVVELDALVHLALLDGGVDQADRVQAAALAGLHRGLHVFGQLGFQAHGRIPRYSVPGKARSRRRLRGTGPGILAVRRRRPRGD